MEKRRTRSPCSPKVSDHSPPFVYTANADNACLFTVLEDLNNELAPVNTRRVLRGVRSKKVSSKTDKLDELDEVDEPELDVPEEPEKLDAKARHRRGECERRSAIRGLLHEISAFFLVKGTKKVSGGEVILFGKSITSILNQQFAY